MKRMVTTISLLLNFSSVFANGSFLVGNYRLQSEKISFGNTACIAEITIVSDNCINIYPSDNGKYNKNYPDLIACDLNGGSKLISNEDMGDGSRIIIQRESILSESSLTINDQISFLNKSGQIFDKSAESILIKKEKNLLTFDFSKSENGMLRSCIYVEN